MNPFAHPLTLLQPPRLVFGVGAAQTCRDDLATGGPGRYAFVTAPQLAAHTEPFCAALAGLGFELIPLTDTPPEPTVAAFESLRTRLRGQALDGVIGFGGGSALDVAKLLAALHRRPEPVATFFGSGKLPPRPLRLICLPTTAGTGSEVSPNAILLDEAAQLKLGVISPHLVPDAAYVDPALTVTVPSGLTAATGLDALVHCLEAYANRLAHPVVDLHALEGIRLIAAHLERAVHHGTDLAARSAVALGSLYGGLCLGPVNTAAVHALSYPLGSAFHVPHGLANALLLPHVIRFNLPAAPARYAAIARALGVTAADVTPREPGGPADELAWAEAGVRRLEALSQACGLPRGLAGCGVTARDIPALVAGAMQVTRLLRNNPRDVTAADATAIYSSALSSS